jgi:hypothetical protein
MLCSLCRIAPLRNDSRESGSGARNALSQQMREDISIDPFHNQPAMPAAPYPVMVPSYGFQSMPNNVQAVPVGANGAMMFAANQAGMAMQAGMGQMGQAPMMAQQNYLNTNGMIAAPVSHMPGSARFNNNSNRNTPNHMQASFNPSRGPPQNGLPYGNQGPQRQNLGVPPRNGGPPGLPGQGQYLPMPPYAAPTRSMPGNGLLPSRPAYNTTGMYNAPSAPMPGSRPR